MAKNKSKEKFMGLPVERHDTAAWANISATKRASKVTLPHEEHVINAKEYVDSNEK